MAEIAEPDVRGRWANCFVVNSHMGQFMVNVIGSYLDIRSTAVICAIVPLTYAILTPFLPESPYYLLMKGRDKEAADALRILRWKQNVQEEYEILKNVIQKQVQESGTIWDLLAVKSNRRASFITIGNRSFQIFSGLYAYIFFAQYIFQQAGGSVSKSAAGMIFTGTFMVGCLINGYILGIFGRRPAMVLSSSICACFLSIEAVYFFIKENTVIELSSFGWVPLFGTIGYIVGMCAGLALVPTLMLGELFPTKLKSKAMCLNSIVTGIDAIVLTKLFQMLVSGYGLFAPFAFFTLCCIASTFYSYLCIPETKGKTLDEIQDYLKR